METKHTRQLLNRAIGLSGSFMAREKAESIHRQNMNKLGHSPSVSQIRVDDQATKRKITN